MANETHATITGNITDDPELRYTGQGVAVASVTIASTPRFFNQESNEWEDGDPSFIRCNIWRDMALNVAESLTRGNRVIVTGRFKQSNWEDKDSGEKRSRLEIDVDEIGTSLRFHTAKPERPETKSQNAKRPSRGNATRNRTSK